MSLIVDFPSQRTLPEEVEPLSPSPRVTFEEENEISYFIDVSAKYKSSLFYTQVEIGDFKRRTYHQMRQMQAKSMTVPDYDEYLCTQDTTEFLGLERCLSRTSYQEIVTERNVLRSAIEYEQARQAGLGIQDFDAIAHVSLVCTDSSRMRARTVALLHAGI